LAIADYAIFRARYSLGLFYGRRKGRDDKKYYQLECRNLGSRKKKNGLKEE